MRRRALATSALAALAVLAPSAGLIPSDGTVLAYVAAPAASPLDLAGTSAASTAVTDNWSGYVSSYDAGQIHGVTGTFTVPSAAGAAAGSTVSQWVGIDGWDNSSLLQAGVDVIAVGHSTAMVEPWWEIVPGPQHLTTGVMVRPGDTVGVDLSQISGPNWSISLTNDTRGEHFTTVQTYSGPLTSAEWVVEADVNTQGKVTRLAPYTPVVRFSSLGLSGQAQALTKVVLVQSGAVVSSPSAMTSAGFSVAYRPPRVADRAS